MTKNVTFQLGPTTGLSARQLTITRIPGAGDVAPLSATYDQDEGAVSTATVSLADNVMYQAKLVDTKTTGEVSAPDILNFHTGSLQFPGPRTGDRLAIQSMEDNSSSSSVSSSSVSSSSPSISTSSSSTSVSSGSSASSNSSSSPSVSTSSSSQSMSTSSSSSSSVSSSSVSSSSKSSGSSGVN